MRSSVRRKELVDVPEHTGTGDPLQSIALLWRTNPKTGRSGLTLDAVVEAAIAVAAEIGIDKLSMRKIADRLGVGVMSLYAHVPGKGELIDLMVDHVHGAVYSASESLPTANGWRSALETVAERNWDLFARHPWLLGIDVARPPLGPGTTSKYDIELAPLIDIGLSDVEVDQVLSLVLGHVRSAAQVGIGSVETARVTAQDDDQWWATAGPVLAAIVDAERFPNASRIGNAAGQEYGSAVDAERAYGFGLTVILDGVQQLVERARS